MSRWCPSCGAEYRDGFDRCADCDVVLVDAPAQPAEPRRRERATVEPPFRPEDDTVELLRTNRLEGEVVAARLQSEGIPTVVFDNDAYGYGPLLTNARGVRVMVRRGDLANARALTVEERGAG